MDGDSNTKFFHAQANARKKKSNVIQLRNDNGELVTGHIEICEVVKSYFSQIFSQEKSQDVNSLPIFDSVITDAQNAKLEGEFTFEEFSVALKQMHPDKSAGPDGLNPAFYQNFWNLLGREVFDCRVNWLNDMSFPACLNDTTIVLIPKKDGLIL